MCLPQHTTNYVLYSVGVLKVPACMCYMVYIGPVFNPWRACAMVTVVVLCVCLSVCLSVYPSVPALSASASVETSKQQYSWVSLRLFLDLYVWSFEKTFLSKVMARKSQYANELELTVSRFRAVSGPTKHSSYLKGNWWVKCCFRG